MFTGSWNCTTGFARALGPGSCLAAGRGRGVAAGLGRCLVVGLGGGRALGCGVAAALGFSWAADAGFHGLRCRPTFPLAGRGAAAALAAAAALRACVDDVARCLAGGVPAWGVVGEVVAVVVLVDVEKLEAEEADVGDGQGSRTAGAGAGCWVLWARRVQVRVRASGMCARLPLRRVCLLVPVPWVVSCVVRGGVVESSWLRGLVSYRARVGVSSRTRGSDS